jgi:hypothetical protein
MRGVQFVPFVQKMSTCSLTHDVSSLGDDNIKSTIWFVQTFVARQH